MGPGGPGWCACCSGSPAAGLEQRAGRALFERSLVILAEGSSAAGSVEPGRRPQPCGVPNRSSTLVTCDIVGRLHRIVTPATVLRWQLRLATPDTAATERALSSCALTVHVSTKLTQPGVVVVHQPTPGSDPALERITSQALETPHHCHRRAWPPRADGAAARTHHGQSHRPRTAGHLSLPAMSTTTSPTERSSSRD